MSKKKAEMPETNISPYEQLQAKNIAEIKRKRDQIISD